MKTFPESTSPVDPRRTFRARSIGSVDLRGAVARPVPTRDKGTDRSFLIGLALLSLMDVQVGGAQFSQLWVLVYAAVLLTRGGIRVMGREALVYGLFFGFAVWLTLFGGYGHIKEVQQIIKFGLVYPAFYLVGRHLGRHYLKGPLPFGYPMLVAFLLIQIAIQKAQVPFIYKALDFGQDAIHGTFLERNWFALFFFGTSYLLFLQSARKPFDAMLFLGIGVANALISESKTVLIPCGVVLMLQVRGHLAVKLLLLAAGSALYFWRFSGDLSGDMLDVRLQEERGLAFTMSIAAIARNWLGYGFGFVEYYFANSATIVRGLGAGNNSMFCSPVDLMLIAGIPGVIAWAVFFSGVGLGWAVVIALAPLTLWSVSNPLHQSEIAYLFIGYLISWGRGQAAVRLPARDTGHSEARRAYQTYHTYSAQGEPL